MVTTAWGGASEADAVALLVDASKGVTGEVDAILSRLGEIRSPKILVLNKIDLVPRDTLLGLAQALTERVRFSETFMI